MKKITSIIVVMILCLNLLIMNVFADSATVSVSAPQSVEKGQAIEVKLNLTATDIYAISGVINYDASQLQLETPEAGYSDLAVAINGANNKFTVYHTSGKFLVNNTGTIVVFKFTVLEETAGATVSVEFNGLEATDGNSDRDLSSASCSFTVAETRPTEPDSSEPETPESKPTGSTESKPAESKPTQSTTSKPTGSTSSQPTESTDSSSVESGSSDTESKPADPSESDKPSDSSTADDDDEQKFCWWWILIVILVACCVWHLIVVFRKKKRSEQDA